MDNDRFKFRAWDKEQKRMYSREELYPQLSVIFDIPIQHRTKILMQSTGLRDKHGKLIFEGDILRHAASIKNKDICTEQICTVEWESSGFIFINTSRTEDFHSSANVFCEIIGNIWEHPQLLNGKE